MLIWEKWAGPVLREASVLFQQRRGDVAGDACQRRLLMSRASLKLFLASAADLLEQMIKVLFFLTVVFEYCRFSFYRLFCLKFGGIQILFSDG